MALLRSVVTSVIFIAGAIAVPAALASGPREPATDRSDLAVFEDLELAKSKNCMSCHQIDYRSVGPSFRMVAARYNGEQDAAPKLANRILKGSAGVWGNIPMPPNPITEAEARTLAEWILER